MLVTTHVFAGALIGLASPDPASAFVTAAVSHFVLDAVPHWGPPPEGDWYPVARADGLAGLSSILTCALVTPRRRLPGVLAGIAGSAVADLDKPARYYFGRSPWPAWLDCFHVRIQRESPTLLPRDVAVCAVLGGVAVAALRLSGCRR
ncbi:MAG: hypothetical protein ACXV5Q_07740 [Frankiaceae bacterium]|jgi:hypothetical protein